MYSAADCFVTLPMFGLVESLNVHTATAVRERALFSRARAVSPLTSNARAQLCLQRVLDLMADAGHDLRGTLTTEQREALREQWHRRLRCAE